ncbi:MAG: alpha/beta hydrolase [Alphaproteobacteria bacterium]
MMRWFLRIVFGLVIVACVGSGVVVWQFNKQNFVADPSAPEYQNRIVALWPEDAVPDYKSNAYGLENWPWYIRYLQKDDVAHKPYMLKYLVESDTPQPAVLVFPGGGYLIRAERHEGTKMAEWLNSLGINAFVVNYRLVPYMHPVPLNDVKQAMQIVRDNADAWGIDPNRIGVMGFSAGGHLAGLASNAVPDALRPDFAILGYAVLAPEHFPMTHLDDHIDVPVKEVSPNLLATAKTPPTFIWQTKADPLVSHENATIYRDTLQAAGVPVELQLFETGGHGLGLAEDHEEAGVWPDLAEAWLRRGGIIE